METKKWRNGKGLLASTVDLFSPLVSLWPKMLRRLRRTDKGTVEKKIHVTAEKVFLLLLHPHLFADAINFNEALLIPLIVLGTQNSSSLRFGLSLNCHKIFERLGVFINLGWRVRRLLS
jgi:hypothetical protein